MTGNANINVLMIMTINDVASIVHSSNVSVLCQPKLMTRWPIDDHSIVVVDDDIVDVSGPLVIVFIVDA